VNAPTGFKDHFSGHADSYARFRPIYPARLFEWLKGQCRRHELAWDVGTGNGQVARGLAKHFGAVHATDASERQIAQAPRVQGVRFAVEPAAHCSLPGHSADLATVGQALHWFDLGRFYAEVERVLKPGGLFAAWTYQLNRIDPAVDRAVFRLYEEVVGPYWPPERVHVEQGYRELPFPFHEVSAPDIVIRRRMNLQDYLSYLGTWSAVRRYMVEQGADPLALVEDDFRAAWGDPEEVHTIEWPLVIRAGVTGLHDG